jgi:hypothetical protein
MGGYLLMKKGGFDAVKDEIKDMLKKEVSAHLASVTQEAAKVKIDQTKHSMIRAVTMLGLFGLGLLFMLLGFAKYLPNILSISEGAAFLAIGLILIIVGLIFRAGGRD